MNSIANLSLSLSTPYFSLYHLRKTIKAIVETANCTRKQEIYALLLH